MTSQDVRSILNLPASAPSGPSAPRKSAAGPRKPDGISRELYALIGDNAPSLAEAQKAAGVRYRERPKMKGKKVEWREVEFTPFARAESSLKLKHWARVTDDDPNASVEHFAKFNLHGLSVMEYSQYEYDQHLTDPGWTPHETAYLFDLLREYDLRFVVAADRYEYRAPKGDAELKTRSVEDMKDRYYTICRRLVRTRTASDPHAQQQQVQQFTFDKAREVKRKQYASELFHLTAAEIAEEEALYVEIKRLEQNERRYRADRDELMRTVIGLDSGLVNLDQQNSEGVLNVDRYKKKRRPEDEVPGPQSPAPPPTKKQKEDAATDAALGIYRLPPVAPAANSSHLAQKHPVHQPVHLRSTRIPLPPSSTALRVPELLAEFGVAFGRLVMPTRANIDIYERVLQAAGGLLDMKRQVDRVEQEIRTHTAQRNGFVPPVDRKDRSESVVSTDTASTARRTRGL
ncbi:swr complex subunit [Cryptotrichosporon argae]